MMTKATGKTATRKTKVSASKKLQPRLTGVAKASAKYSKANARASRKSGHWCIVTTATGRNVLAPTQSSGINRERVRAAISELKQTRQS